MPAERGQPLAAGRIYYPERSVVPAPAQPGGWPGRARDSCSARTVASSRWTSARMGASAPRVLRHRASWLAYRSSWRPVSRPGSRSGMGGQPGPVVLLGDHVIEPGLQVAPRLRYGIHPVAGRDRVLQLAAMAAQLGGGERVQGMFRLCDACWVDGHGGWS